MTVDFDKLIAANLICQKWADHFKTKANGYHVFIADLRRNPSAYLAQLHGQDRHSLELDLKTMFYAAEIENGLIIQYRPSIFYVCRRYRIKGAKIRQDLFDLGLLSLRYSIWRYRKYDCSFKTFAIRGLLTGFKGYLSDRKKAFSSEAKKFDRRVTSLNMEVDQEDYTMIPEFKGESAEEFVIRKEQEITLEMLIKTAKLSATEQELLSFYMDKDNVPENKRWRNYYCDHYKTKYGKTISKSLISDKIRVVRKRLHDALVELKGQEFAGQYSCVG